MGSILTEENFFARSFNCAKITPNGISHSFFSVRDFIREPLIFVQSVNYVEHFCEGFFFFRFFNFLLFWDRANPHFDFRICVRKDNSSNFLTQIPNFLSDFFRDVPHFIPTISFDFFSSLRTISF